MRQTLPKPRSGALPAGTSTDRGPLALLAALLVSGDQRIAASGIGDFSDSSLEILGRTGVLLPDGHLENTICDACQEPHLVPVILDPEGHHYDGKCPVEGFLGRKPQEVAALSFTIEKATTLLADALSETFGPRRERPRAVDEGAWLLGSWRIGGGWTAVVVALSIDRVSAARRVRNALAGLPRPYRGLVLVPGEDDGFQAPPPFVCIPFETAFEINDSGRILAASAPLVAAATIASAPLVAKGGRPGVGWKVTRVLDGLLAQGQISRRRPALSGIVARSWKAFFPSEEAPSGPAIRKHAALWRKTPHDERPP